MTVHEEWTDQLSDYLDGELSVDERGAVEAHLHGCAACAAVLNDLKRVVAQAQSVDARPPHADLWAGIASRIETERRASGTARVMRLAPRDARRFAFTLPELAAAAALLMAVSGGVAWQVALRSPARRQAQGIPSSSRDEGLRHSTSATDAAQAPGQAVALDGQDVAQGFSRAGDARVETVGMADAQYDAAVADLEKALQAGRGRLDTSTISIVERNLQIIDQAISQAREALAGDPANSYLSSHLVEARRRKLDLLRRATALATETN
jgi:anti-sigma factor RsiW